jgi:Transposase DDE domain group 1
MEVTQMVTNRIQHSGKEPVKQGAGAMAPEPNKIGASTPFDFSGKNLTPYGGLLPVATMLEKLGFQGLMEETVMVKRLTTAMSGYQFLLAMVLGLYIGFSRLNQLRFVARDPILTGVLKIVKLPPQCTLWRFLAALHGSVAQQILSVQGQMRRHVWEAANVRLKTATLDTDTTVHTLYGRQMGGRKSYNPKNKGKKSYQPILTFLAETREYLAGELRSGDRPTGKQIARHLHSAFQSLPEGVEKIFARADAGFYCWEAVEAYEQLGCQFIVVARKTSRLVEELKRVQWKPSPKTDADAECEFRYQPDGWGQAFRFVALRYQKKPEELEAGEAEQYQLFATSGYTYRVFVTNLKDPIDLAVWFYNQRAGAENLIKEANNDAGLAAHPSKRFDVNGNHFQLAMLAYNLNCWLMLFNREASADAGTLRHTTLATARLRFLFVAAKIWRHAGRTGVSYSDHYQERGVLQRMMDRLRAIAMRGSAFAPVVEAALT